MKNYPLLFASKNWFGGGAQRNTCCTVGTLHHSWENAPNRNWTFRNNRCIWSIILASAGASLCLQSQKTNESCLPTQFNVQTEVIGRRVYIVLRRCDVGHDASNRCLFLSEVDAEEQFAAIWSGSVDLSVREFDWHWGKGLAFVCVCVHARRPTAFLPNGLEHVYSQRYILGRDRRHVQIGLWLTQPPVRSVPWALSPE
jgi:hypothetical protein